MKTKQKRILKNFSQIICEFLSGKSYLPLSMRELIKRLNIQKEHHLLFKQVLKSLVKSCILKISKKRYSLLNRKTNIASGVLRVHQRGFAFLQPNDSKLFPQDVYIPKHLTKNAVDGDTVEVCVNEGSKSEKGPEGKVLTILKRARKHISGTVLSISKGGLVSAYVPLLGLSRHVVVKTEENIKLKIGDRLIMKVMEWGDKNTETVCKVSHKLGNISSPSCDIKAAIEEFELRENFPSQVIEEIKKFGKRVSTKEIKNRKDLRNLESFTIDPDTAKDFDDALSLSRDRKGFYHLHVHISDVSHYVAPNSPLDEEAKKRCNSTYFPGYCLPMLPPELSENLCSLKPEVNRLCISVLLKFNKTGKILDYQIFRSVIKSSKRFTYKEAKDILDKKKRSKYAHTLNLMLELCKLLKKRRYERGSIEFALPDAYIQVDDNGKPLKIDLIEYDVTHQIVEEFMITTNEIIAQHLNRQNKELTYRVHEKPAEENLKDFSIIAGAYGFRLSETPTMKELQQLFNEAKKSPYIQQLATNYIRNMKLACYSPKNLGHYGLNLECYCHFTSPIRRYADLSIHRQIFEKDNKYENFHSISTMCSEQERISAKAENAVILLKKMRLLEKIIKEDPYHEFSATITKVKPFGFYFCISNYMMEGFLRISEIGEDYFVYDEKRLNFKGSHTKISYQCGNEIKVTLKDLNFITLESNWSLVPQNQKYSRPKKRNKFPC